MKRAGRGEGEAKTGERIRESALALFRKRGFEATTMRDIAKAAELSLGAAYYYFPSKEAIVLSYYDDQLAGHERLARAAFAKSDDVPTRIRSAFLTKLEASKDDRPILGALMHTIGEPHSAVSLFSKETAAQRARSVAIFDEALSPAGLDEGTRRAAALALWTAHLGMLLYFLHDTSRGARKTKKLVEDSLSLLAPMMPFLAAPPIAKVLGEVQTILEDAGLDVAR
jgi:AcrR family transcriptional regulator